MELFSRKLKSLSYISGGKLQSLKNKQTKKIRSEKISYISPKEFSSHCVMAAD